MALEIHAGADAQDEAVGLREVEVALVEAVAGRDVDGDVADLDVAQLERLGIDVGVERHGDADFVGVGAGAEGRFGN